MEFIVMFLFIAAFRQIVRLTQSHNQRMSGDLSFGC